MTSSKRIERTQAIYNGFTSSIQDRVHIVLSLDSCISNEKLSKMFRDHSTLFTEFYIDVYRPFKLDTINCIARYYLALQNEEAKVRKFNKKFNSHFINANPNNNPTMGNSNNHQNNVHVHDEDDYDEDEENLTLSEIHTFSTIMTDLHLIASETYLKSYNLNKSWEGQSIKLFMPKPFCVSIFKQIAIYFKVYMKRIKEAEQIKVHKFEKAFQKINQVVDKIKNYDNEKEEYLSQLNTLEKSLSDWDEQIGKQKEQYKVNLLVFQGLLKILNRKRYCVLDLLRLEID
jgi:hypothetical protein